MNNLKLKTAPSIEPITLAEIKEYLKITDRNNTNSGLTVSELFPIAERTANTYTSTGLLVTGYNPTIELIVGEIKATGKLDITIQESNDDATYTDYLVYTQLNPTTDNQTYKIEYSGDKAYIKVVAKVSTVNSTFAVNCILNQGFTSEDDYLTALITASREYVESYQNRALITQTYEYTLPDFISNKIELPKGNLQKVDSITYKNSEGTITTLTENTDYIVGLNGVLGYVTPAYNKSWASFTPFPIDAVKITYTCGYGDTSASIPKKTIQAIKLLVSHWYENREPVPTTNNKQLSFTLDALLWQERIIEV